MATPEFVSFMAHYKVSAEDCKIIADPPFGLTTIEDYGMFFEAESSFKAQMFSKVVSWEGKGYMIAALKKAWLAAVEVGVKLKADKATAAAASTPTDDDDKPIDAAIQTSLLERFPQQYKFDIPLNWLGNDFLIGKLWRQINHRKLERTKIAVWQTADAVLALQGRRQQTVALSQQVTFKVGTHNDMSKPAAPMNSPLRYLFGLQIYVYSLAFAGCSEREITRQPLPHEIPNYPTVNPRLVREKQNLVVLQDMYDHLASAQYFVMKWSTQNPPMAQDDILKELTRKDESIRTRWAINYNSNANKELSLSQVIELCTTNSKIDWEQDITPAGTKRPLKGGGKADSPHKRQRSERGNGGGGGGGGGRGNGGGGGNGPPTGKGKGNSKNKGAGANAEGTANHNGGRVKTLKKRKVDGVYVEYCWSFAIGKCTNAHCTRRNRCPIMTHPGQACDKPHKMADHTGPTISA